MDNVCSFLAEENLTIDCLVMVTNEEWRFEEKGP